MYPNRIKHAGGGQNPLYPIPSEQVALSPIKRTSKIQIRSHFPKAPHNSPTEIQLGNKKITHSRLSKSNSPKLKHRHVHKEKVSKPRFHSIIYISKKSNQIIGKTSLENVSQSPSSNSSAETSLSTKKVRHRHKRQVVSPSNSPLGETKNEHKDQITPSLRDPSKDIIVSFLSKKFKMPFHHNGFDPEATNNIVNKLAIAIFNIHQQPSECNLRIAKNNYTKGNTTNYDATFNIKSTIKQDLNKIEKTIDKINNIHIHLYFPNQNPIAKIAIGGWKIIKNSFTFILPGGDVESILIIPSVVQRALKNVTYSEYLQVLGGVQHQAALNEMLDADHQLAVAPGHVMYTTKEGWQRMELEMPWYNGTFSELRDGIPLTRTVNPKEVCYGDSTVLDILINQAETLHLLHQQNIVHGDVKGRNILITINQEQKANGFLSDPDYINVLGFSDEPSKPYVYWDLARHHGYSFPSCDIYGLVVMAAADFLPIKIEKMDQNWFKEFASNKFYRGSLMQIIGSVFLQDSPHAKNLCLRLTLTHNKTSLEILNMIQTTLLDIYKNVNLCEKEQQELKAIETDLVVCEKFLTMLANQINCGRELWSKIEGRPDYIAIFKSENTQKKKKLYDQIVNSIRDFPSAKDISERFKEIKILLQSTS